jgi:glutathione synthase/RimK-type ligase-like ATP-grasp enzyme
LLPEPEALDRIEASWAARWLVESLDRGRFPLGHPEVLRHGSNKVRQLAVAREVGFRIPDTIISTEPEALLQFCGHHDVVVVKAVKTLLVLPKDESRAAETRVLGSRSVPSSELVPLIEDSPATSLFIQEHIDKKFDVRVNVLPNGSVACLIHLDLLPPGAIDWRPQTMELDHEIIEFPEHLDRLCRDYLAKLGLSWGAFDFGLTRDGEWVFFECNPNGQWLWIEIKTGYPLSARFAETLLEHHGRGSR